MDLLKFLFGSGIATAALTAFVRRRAKRKKLRREQVRGADKFPFKVIRQEADLFPSIMPGRENDPLVPGAIAYQKRTSSGITPEWLADLLLRGEQRWLLLIGGTGAGKTRETVEIARLMLKHGWTVLNLTNDYELNSPATPPEGVPTSKLLFVLDDLNRRMRSSHFYDGPNADDPEQPLHVPLQRRLLRALEQYEQFYRPHEVRVLATARNEKIPDSPNEPSEWEKLEFGRYRDLWDRFELVNLPEPDDLAVCKMLEATSCAAGIDIDNPTAIVKSNDRTFGNIVANLQRARANKTMLTPANFQNTLRGTWQKRYEDAVQRNPLAADVFRAIAALRALGAPLMAEVVTDMAVDLGERSAQLPAIMRWLVQRKVRRALQHLVQDADILNPRDGQIEPSGQPDLKKRNVK